MGVILANFDMWLLLPFALWIVLFAAGMRYFVPKLKVTAEAQPMRAR